MTAGLYLRTPEIREKMSFAHLGLIPWNKGKPRLDIIGDKNPAKRLEVRRKISKALTGKKLSEETKKKISEYQLGKKLSFDTRRKISIALKKIREKSNFWKGGIYPINKAIRKSIEYRLWRSSVFERDLYTCQFCKQRGGKLHADHIKQFAFYPELRFDVNNGRTLCEDCHRKTNTWGYNGYKLNLKGVK